MARSLAVQVIEEQPFEEISEETYEKAVTLLKTCRNVIICDTVIGKINRKLLSLIDVAEKECEVYYANMEGARK